jgi:putative RNA 2'-phosphotransferase
MTTEQRSKYLSLLLRHKPETANLTLDKEGWCDITQLITNTDFTVEELEKITETDAKGRYSIRYWEMAHCGSDLEVIREPTHIRANQGHSTKSVKMHFKVAVPPVVLYHGADDRFMGIIMKEGLTPQKRHHVHLSADVETAQMVGGRRRSGHTVLAIDAKQMLAVGHKFFISENGVWLVDHVPPKYLKEHA